MIDVTQEHSRPTPSEKGEADPLVSVLVAAHNAGPWIAETIESVLRQTYTNLELIVVDDGSTDETFEIAKRFEELERDRMRVVTQENRGACAARNRALAEARGAFIQYLDADDLLHSEKIERQVRLLQFEPAGTVASGPWVRFAADARGFDHTRTAPDFRDFEPAYSWLLESWQGRGTLPIHSWLIPRGLAESAGPWNERLLRNQDGEYVARVLVRATRVAFVEGAWSYYRIGNASSISRRRNEEALRSLFESNELCESALLLKCSDPEALRACSGLWQHFVFAAYPEVPDLTARALLRIEQSGGFYIVPSVIRPLRFIRDVLGWRVALRLQRNYRVIKEILRTVLPPSGQRLHARQSSALRAPHE